jgi:hypothetical protein
MQPRLPPAVLRELEGRSWQLIPGRRHWRLMIDGVQVTILSHGSFLHRDLHAQANLRATVRRFLRNSSALPGHDQPTGTRTVST